MAETHWRTAASSVPMSVAELICEVGVDFLYGMVWHGFYVQVEQKGAWSWKLSNIFSVLVQGKAHD